MREFQTYDQTIEQKNQWNVQKALPLLCWEFYSEHHTVLQRFKADIDQLQKLSRKWSFEHNYLQELVVEQTVVLVTNPDLKIVFASHNIEELNGYSSNQVIGKSPKMFQGEGTCSKTSAAIGKAVKQHKPFEYSILNYRKDKEVYTCHIKGFPVFDFKGNLVNYIAFEKAA